MWWLWHNRQMPARAWRRFRLAFSFFSRRPPSSSVATKRVVVVVKVDCPLLYPYRANGGKRHFRELFPCTNGAGEGARPRGRRDARSERATIRVSAGQLEALKGKRDVVGTRPSFYFSRMRPFFVSYWLVAGPALEYLCTMYAGGGCLAFLLGC
ncbi:hypothetical protein LZ32DRAFT_219014 [Colletotrichum eremochloae]|nr:hypothetical protein LY78DRAFT_187449 [Colletotrichum sublineola]KAK2019057.1 hypothetical protein LZ32DRAFT_219014 [Colletotrichum eremochloae]